MLTSGQVLSGAAGVTYGANNVMQMYIPGLYVQDGSGPAYAWYEDINLPGASQIQYIKQVILDRGEASCFTRVPAQDIIAGNAGTDDKRVTAARDSAGSWIIVYTPTGKPFSIDTQSLDACDIGASWVDPILGTYATLEYSQCNESSSAIRQFTPPTAETHVDWVLVLEANNAE